jgi:SRSO17 transposase
MRMQVGDPEARFDTFVEQLAAALGHADRVAPLRAYCTGLILPGERKSIEPIAARLAPTRVQATHQALHHLVAKANWRDEAVLAAVRAYALPAIERHGPIRAWIVDDTGFAKKGRHSVGVARQYCGQLGKQDNCQVAVTLAIANEHASLPIAYRLYLPEPWANDPQRRATAGVPETVVFQSKPRIALDQIRRALAQGVPVGVVLADAGYGIETAFRTDLSDLGLLYALGIQSSTSLWPPGMAPLPPKPWSGQGRPPKRLRRQADHKPISAKALAKRLPATAWTAVTWREGSRGELSSRFAAVRVRPAHRDYGRAEPYPEEWLLVEWPEGEAEPTKYWLSTLPADVPLSDLVATAKLRWRIERDFQELKQEIGLGHYEGRGWRGFHHHASLCIAAYGFLVAERSLVSPSGSSPAFKVHDLPAGYRPRGAAAPARAARGALAHDDTSSTDPGSGSASDAMSLLSPAQPPRPTTRLTNPPLVTQ